MAEDDIMSKESKVLFLKRFLEKPFGGIRNFAGFMAVLIFFGVFLVLVTWAEVFVLKKFEEYVDTYNKIINTTIYFIPCILTGTAFFYLLTYADIKIFGKESMSSGWRSGEGIVRLPRPVAYGAFLILAGALFMFFFSSNLILIGWSDSGICAALGISAAEIVVIYVWCRSLEDKYPERCRRIRGLLVPVFWGLVIMAWYPIIF